MPKSRRILYVTIFILIISVIFGFILAKQKPLWNDEIFTEVQGGGSRSYFDILTGNTGSEANACPLYWILHKSAADVFRYELPVKWEGQWLIEDTKGQIILRMVSNLCMSLTIALLFYFFARQFSLLAGLYALAVTLSTQMVWMYWAEARPYALWFFLSALQSCLFLNIIQKDQDQRSSWTALNCTHICMALTIVASMAQVAAVSLLLWIFKERNLKKYILLTVVPVCIGLFYYVQTPKLPYEFPESIHNLLFANMPKDRLAIILAYFVFCIYFAVKNKTKINVFLNEDARRASVVYLLFAVLMVCFSYVIFEVFKLRMPELEQSPVKVHERYFLYLTPITIVATTFFSIKLLAMFKKYSWMFYNILIVLTGLFTLRCIETYMLIMSRALY